MAIIAHKPLPRQGANGDVFQGRCLQGRNFRFDKNKNENRRIPHPLKSASRNDNYNVFRIVVKPVIYNKCCVGVCLMQHHQGLGGICITQETLFMFSNVIAKHVFYRQLNKRAVLGALPVSDLELCHLKQKIIRIKHKSFFNSIFYF